jgi:glycosyltransferase involved in cell wall biosynthesis
MPLVSIVIPLYNSRATLHDCVESVLHQTHSNFEIILVDGGSDEIYADIISHFNDSRIVYYKLKHLNANVARNYGIVKSKGKYIAMLDSDDLWLPNHLCDCIETIEANGADGLYGSLIVRNKMNGNEQEFRARDINEDEAMVNYLLNTGYGAQTSTLFLSAESAKTIQWDETLKRHQDYDFVIRYSQSYKIKPKFRASVVYNITSKNSKIDFDSCIRVIEKYKYEIEPFLYGRYNQNMMRLAINMHAGEEIIRHYKKESVKYIEYISYIQYIMICNRKTQWGKLKCKLKYLLYISHTVVN